MQRRVCMLNMDPSIPVSDDIFKVSTPLRRELTLADKIELIKAYESSGGGVSVRRLAQRFNIGKTSALRIIKLKDEYLGQFSSNFGENRRRIRHHSKYQEINACMWKWYRMTRYKRINVTGSQLQKQALKFSTKLCIHDFKASNGWLDSFKKCYNIRALSNIKSGSQQSQTNLFNDFDWKSRLPRLIGDFDLEDVFSFQEISLYFRAMPVKTQNCPGDSNLLEERLTLLLCCSAVGEKLAPWVIKNDLTVSRVDDDNQCCVLRTSVDSTMTRDIFINYMENLDVQLRRKNRKILIFLNQSPSHFELDILTHVNLKFLPINTMMSLQPLDLGVTRLFRGFYRRQQLSSIVNSAENSRSGTTQISLFSPDVNIGDALRWVSHAWDSVGADIIMKCFSDAGFPYAQYILPADFEELVECELTSLMISCTGGANVSVDDYLAFDSMVEAEKDNIPDDWEEQIMLEVLAERNVTPEEIVSVNMDTDDEEFACEEVQEKSSGLLGSEMTHSDAMELIVKLKNFSLTKENCLLPFINGLKDTLETVMAEKQKPKK